MLINDFAYRNYMRAYQNARYHRRLERAFKLLGHKCKICGSREGVGIAPIDPQKPSFSKLLARAAEKKFRQEIKDYRVLCKDHRIQQGVLKKGMRLARGTHGTLSAYRYCGPPKCEACKQVKKEYARKRKERLRNSTVE